MSGQTKKPPHPFRGRFQSTLNRNWRRLGRDGFEPGQFKIDRLEVNIPGLAPAFTGYRIVQITDLHMGHWINAARLVGLVEMANELAPDLVVLTGDYVSYVVDEIAAEMTAGLSSLQAADGVLAILGNHDHWMGAERISDIMHAADITVLRNDVHRIVRAESSTTEFSAEPTAEFYVAGLDCVTVGADDLPALLAQLPDAVPAILLAHEPDFADRAAATGRFALQLSGHSHGGQIVVPRIGPLFRGPLFWKYPLGAYQVKQMVLYTNRGAGTHILRLRINCPPEITLITLYPA